QYPAGWRRFLARRGRDPDRDSHRAVPARRSQSRAESAEERCRPRSGGTHARRLTLALGNKPAPVISKSLAAVLTDNGVQNCREIGLTQCVLIFCHGFQKCGCFTMRTDGVDVVSSQIG